MIPKFSVLLPVLQPNPEELQATIQSVVTQTFAEWELIAVVNGAQSPAVDSMLNSLADERFTVVRRADSGRRSAAYQDALMSATGEFVSVIPSGDVLPNKALARVAIALDEDDEVDFIYTDEDHLDDGGSRVEPVLKPGFSPERLRTQPYTGNSVYLRRSVVNDVGGFRDGFDGAEGHDIALRVSEQARKIGHLPEVLYHHRKVESGPPSSDGRQRAVASHLERTGFPATAAVDPGESRVVGLEPNLAHQPLVSIIIPTGYRSAVTRGRQIPLIENALQSLTEVTAYENYEVVVVIDSTVGHDPDPALGAIDSRIRCVRDLRPVSLAGLRNLGAVSSKGEVLVFLDDDTQIIQPSWLDRLVMYTQCDNIGPVGGKLLLADERIQHVGIWSRGGHLGHRYQGFSRNHDGYMQSLLGAQNCVSVTGACLAVRRQLFDLVGGFSSSLPFNFGDVDLCLKLASRGFRTVVDCCAELMHFDSTTIGPPIEQTELDAMAARWGDQLRLSAWDNPNHTSGSVDEFPPTSESLLQNWEATGESERHVRIWTNQKLGQA